MRTALFAVVMTGLSLCPASGRATQFTSGAIIVPMDTTYQDNGMLSAYGLLYQLLKVDIPVHWVIKAPKQVGDADFTVAAADIATAAAIAAHGYRGGPFVIEAQHAAQATPVIAAWQAVHPETTVHVAQQAFTGRTGRLLTAAPTIAVIADSNEDIAFGYLNAAGIPDSSGQPWPNKKLGDYSTYPDILTIAEVAGPTDTDHSDGALFLPSGQPAFCQIMTMHWSVKEVVDEVVAEYRAFLQFPTHMMAECQAVNAIENNINGRFLTPNGFLIDNNVADSGPFELLNADTPFGQMDGPDDFKLVNGSERAYSLPAGDQFHDAHVVMIKDATTAVGQRSIWMTGYVDGACMIGEDPNGPPVCTAGVGKVSYLGGHEFETKLPISSNPGTQGTRLFLNSLFEASCTTSEGQPVVALTKSGPATTTSDTVTYTLQYTNFAPGPALALTLSDDLPPGASFVSCTGGCAESGGTVTWFIGDVGAGAVGSVDLVVSLGQYGTYVNQFSAAFTVGVNTKTVTSNPLSTDYQSSFPPDAAVADAAADGGAADGSDGAIASDGSPADGTAPPAERGVADGAGDATARDDAAEDSSSGADAGGAADAGATARDAAADRGTGRGDGGTGADAGCDCSVNGDGAHAGLALLALLLVRRRRRGLRPGA